MVNNQLKNMKKIGLWLREKTHLKKKQVSSKFVGLTQQVKRV
jgi:hypothetical protein